MSEKDAAVTSDGPHLTKQALSRPIRKNSCLRCHFLMKWRHQRDGGTRTGFVSDEQRLRLAQGETAERVVGPHFDLACSKEVWDCANPRPDEDHDLLQRVSRDRGETCFFYPRTPGMLFPAAAELERREADRREAKRDRALTKWQIIVGVAAAFACVVLGAVLTKFLG